MGHSKFSQDSSSTGFGAPIKMSWASEDHIDTFLTFTGTHDRDKAKIFINNTNGDLDAAVNSFWENPNRYDRQNQGYDESAFHADRYGDAQQAQTSFTIHPEDDSTALLNPQHSNAPTGPPSRSNTPQEEGYIGTAQGVSFSKAQQAYYDPSKWSLTTTAQSNPVATEIWPDVIPPERERMPGQPCFVKPLTEADLIPCLLTILGSTPATRQALSCYEHVGQDYGFHSEWWTGSAIPETIIEGDGQDGGAEAIANMRSEFIYEIQRMMGSLLASTRSYISAEALMKSRQMNQQQFPGIPIETNTAHLAVAWEDAAAGLSMTSDKTRNMFSTSVAQQDGEMIDLQRCDEFQLAIDPDGSQNTLYDVIDDSIWVNDPDGSSNEAYYIAEAGNVLIFQMRQMNASKRGLEIDVPTRIYIDRYMKENAGLLKQVRQAGLERKHRMQALEDKKARLQTFRWSGAAVKSDKSADLVSHAIAVLEREQSNATAMQQDSSTMSASAPFESSALDIVSSLRALQADLDARIQSIDQQQQQLDSELRQIKDIFKTHDQDMSSEAISATPQAPAQDLDSLLHTPPRYGYSLRGAATDPSTTYLIHKAEGSSADAEDPDNPLTHHGYDEWWNVSFYSNPSFECQRRSEGEILTAIRETSRNVMLVYVSDAFMARGDQRRPGQETHTEEQRNPQPPNQTEFNNWPPGLKTFVQRDNEAFAAELEECRKENDRAFPMYVDGLDPDQYDQYEQQQKSGDVQMSDGLGAVNYPKSTWD